MRHEGTKARRHGEGASRFSLSRIRAELKPFRVYWVSSVGSTNDYAARLRKRGKLFAPAVVLTGRQTAGRGRGKNLWWSSAGVLTVTFAIPIEERLLPQELPLIAGLAVRQTAAALTGDPSVELKWPNDVLHEGKKLAGLLCERVNRVDLIGIGLNVNVDPADAPRELRSRITSLLSIGGKTLDMNDVLNALAKELRLTLRKRMEQPFAVFVREYHQHDALAGKNITVIPAGDELPLSGRYEGIDDQGRLMIKTRGATHHILAGQVMLNET